MRKQVLGRCVAVAAGAALLLPVAAGTATASAAYGSCSDGGKSANFYTDYTVSGSYSVVTQFNWVISGSGLGNKNNVEARQKYDVSRGSDPILYTYISGDDVHPGAGSHKLTRAVSIGLEKNAYTEYKFVFDKSGPDPKCSAHTSTF